LSRIKSSKTKSALIRVISVIRVQKIVEKAISLPRRFMKLNGLSYTETALQQKKPWKSRRLYSINL